MTEKIKIRIIPREQHEFIVKAVARHRAMAQEARRAGVGAEKIREQDGKQMISIKLRKKAIGIKYWPYGAEKEDVQSRLLDWAEARKVRYADIHNSSAQCRVCWLKGKRCKLFDCPESNNSRYWMDHVTTWKRDGRPAILLAQPYHVSGDDLEHLRSLEADGLVVSIHGNGWYGHGTVCIEITREQKD
jgi:uncharacterized protein (DUF736 family)